MRAQTREGCLQVEFNINIARTQYGTLERQKGGIGLRGPGETQLEADRRHSNLIRTLKRDLELVQLAGGRQRTSSTQLVVSLVGYTNAGKSTLLNQLSGASIYAQVSSLPHDLTRQVELPQLEPMLMTIQLDLFKNYHPFGGFI